MTLTTRSQNLPTSVSLPDADMVIVRLRSHDRSRKNFPESDLYKV